MATHRVFFREVATYCIEVDAEDEIAAKIAANDKYWALSPEQRDEALASLDERKIFAVEEM